MGALDDYEDAYSREMQEGYGGALSASPVAPVMPEDVDSRKNIFNQAAQRLMQARQSMRQPYQGSDLGMLAMGQSLGAASGMPVAKGYTEGAMNQALAQQKQQEAMQGYNQQQQGLDLQAQLAQILGDGGSLGDAAALAAVGGQDKISDNLAKLDLYGSGKGNVTLTAARELMKQNPGMDFATAFSIAKSGLGQGVTIKDGKVVNIEGAPDAASEMKKAEKGGGKTGELEAEKAAAFPKATARLNDLGANSDVLLKNIDKALPNVNAWTAGLGAVALDKIPLTDARDLRATIDTIKANAGFQSLQEMRDNSPTGGALGQVSDFENKLLQAKLYNLENSQSKEQLKSNLEDFRQAVLDSRKRVRQAYEMDYGKFIKNPAAPDSAAKSTYTTPEEIGAAYKAGKLTKEQAKAELKAHGLE